MIQFHREQFEEKKHNNRSDACYRGRPHQPRDSVLLINGLATTSVDAGPQVEHSEP